MKGTVQVGKKVIIIVPTLSKGGAEKVAASLSLYFPEEITVQYILYQNDIKYQYKGSTVSLNIDPSKNIFTKTYNFFKRLIRIKLILMKEKPYAVFSFMEDPNLINILVNKNAIISVREHKSSSVYTDFKNRFIIKNFYNRSKKIIAVSNGIKEDLIQNFSINPLLLTTIHNLINVSVIQELAKESLQDSHESIFKKRVIISVGRLCYQKGQDDLLKAFASLNNYSDLNMVFLGEGEDRAKLEKIVIQNNLKDRVHFLGFQSNPYKFISRSSLFVLSSRWEGFPNAILEAMACNIPVVSSDCPTGPSEIFLDNKFGNLFQVGNIDQLSIKLQAFLGADNTEFLLWCKNRLLSFNPNVIAKQYLDLANEN